MPSSTPESLQKFVSSCAGLKDEKSDAQTFLNRFFQAFGYGDAAAAGAVMEKRIKKGSKSGKTGFADLVWTPKELPGVLIEMKKKGEDLSKHYAQALQYWTFQVPKPKYVVLCNFDEFWIYDFNIQVDTPVDRVSLAQFVDRAPSAFAFMESSVRKPVFQNNQQEITEKAGKRMGELCQMLKARGARDGFDDLAAQRFVLQCVLAMFAEDRGLLPRDLFVSCVQECLAGASSYDVLGGLFLAMNTPGRTPAGRYKDVEYFNGGLFARVHPIELTENELRILDVAAREDWSRVRPAIFGNIFEGTANAVERHKHGMHYTSEVDIMKIVRPTISRYWEERIAAAGTIGELNQLQLELQNYRVLDPACGSGNFLYLAYLELKRIERLLLDRIAERRRGSSEQMAMGFVTPLQFFGIDLNPFAVELARVTLMIARKIAIDNFGIVDQPALPLDSLDENIVCADALFTEWPKADAIIGNPPFLGGKHMRINLGDSYIDKVFQRFPEVKDSVDFCAYWFRLTQDNLGALGRAGLVATNSISQGKSRAASLDYVVGRGGVIHDAISSQVWSGEANVHVSLVNWVK
ncbi:MAG: SAM-dependent methyltransferase, partial [Alkalinema sp. CACIAM 70d]